MDFRFTANGLNKDERRVQRALEILPGAVSWTILAGMTVLSFVRPLVAAVLIIAFYMYWFFRLIYLTIFLILSYFRLSMEKNTDWMGRIEEIDRWGGPRERDKKNAPPEGLRDRLSDVAYRRAFRQLMSSGNRPPASEDIHHLVIIPVAKESRQVIEPGIRSIAGSLFPTDRILVVLALEERAPEDVKKGARDLLSEYGERFCEMFISLHPDGIPGEARAKGANTTYAARKAADHLNGQGIPFEHVLVSCFDSDTVINPDYFASLTYYFMMCPHRLRASYQPIPVYNNNIWDAPGMTRVLETGSSFFQLIEATDPEKMVTFSSHSMSFRALVDTGYWPVDMISDDSAIYWKAFIHYHGKYGAVPMYTTVSMDAVVADSWWHTVVNVYKQKRRWAWGVENLPIVIRGFLQDRQISAMTKVKSGFKLFEGHISWATWAFLLTIIGWLPGIFAGREYADSVFYYSAPRISGVIFNLASFALLTSIVLSLMLLPRRKERHGLLKRVGFAFQWLLVPVTMVFLSAIPALDAQTRLMTARYMTFWVTDKGRYPTE
jgi:hypothetical protein